MILSGFFDGMKESLSSKGNAYADIFFRGMDGDGLPDFEQSHYRTFDADVIAGARKLAKDDVIVLDIQIRDAVINGLKKE